MHARYPLKTLRKIFSECGYKSVYVVWPVNMKPAKLEEPGSPGFIKLRIFFEVVSVLYDLFCPVEWPQIWQQAASLGMMIYSGVFHLGFFF